MLGQSRKLVLLISILGSFFTRPTISALAALNDIDADRCLNKLLRERLIKVVADKPDTSYVFLKPLLLGIDLPDLVGSLLIGFLLDFVDDRERVPEAAARADAHQVRRSGEVVEDVEDERDV